MTERITIKAKRKDSQIATVHDVVLKVGNKVIPPSCIAAIDIRIRPDEAITTEVELFAGSLDIVTEGTVTEQ